MNPACSLFLRALPGACRNAEPQADPATSARRGARQAEAAALHQARRRLFVTHAARRRLLRGAWSSSLSQCTRLRRGIVSWHELATADTSPLA